MSICPTTLVSLTEHISGSTWSRSQFLVWFCTEKWFFSLKLCLTSGGSTRCWNPISLFLLFVGLCFPLFLHLAGMQVKPQFCSRRKENRWWIYALFIVNVVFFKHFFWPDLLCSWEAPSAAPGQAPGQCCCCFKGVFVLSLPSLQVHIQTGQRGQKIVLFNGGVLRKEILC